MIDETEDYYIPYLNTVYDKEGFLAVLKIISDDLEFGTVTETEKDIYEITTGGWSEDERTVKHLLYPTCKSKHHYIGYITGGAYYFTTEKHQSNKIRITHENNDDEYHTIEELYDYRLIYNALLFNEWHKNDVYEVYKSRRHSDGELCFDGEWFIVIAILPTGQISNHYHIDYWDYFHIPSYPQAKDKYDNHTSKDVLERLTNVLGNPRIKKYKKQTNDRFELTHNSIEQSQYEIIDTEQDFITIYNDLGSIYFSSAPELCQLLNELHKENTELRKQIKEGKK